ncbi:transcription elongation factor A protein-like 4 [Sorex fumeus]|uniref:transcription elongation factor A protein-like 4 n=1 Tax=Sorex fumeus TaxID=62283 RepID=UPI0024ACFDB2|nr:transcription elongation factor A protein-like 4 [Sorex fumeus]
MEKPYSENEKISENKGNMESEEKPEDMVKQEVASTVDNTDKLYNEKKTGDEMLIENEKVDNEAKLEHENVKEEHPETQEKPASEGKLESEEKANEEKPTSEPRAAEKRPAEDDVPRKVKRKTKGLAQCLKEHKEAIHEKHLSNEEMIKEFDKMAWVEDEVKKTRLKLGRFMCMHKRSEDASQPRGPRENQGGGMAPQKGPEDTSPI